MSKNSTSKERMNRLLIFLKKQEDQREKCPSYREICSAIGLKSPSNIGDLLAGLKAENKIDYEPGDHRSIRLTQRGRNCAMEPLGTHCESTQLTWHIPIWGPIVASQPIPMPDTDFSYFSPEDEVLVLRSELPSNARLEELYALEVRGDSMKDAMVCDGDIVVLKKSSEAYNGDMIAAWLTDKDETTLKHFQRKENGKGSFDIFLVPANTEMKPIHITNPQHLEVRGIVVKVIRKYRK